MKTFFKHVEKNGKTIEDCLWEINQKIKLESDLIINSVMKSVKVEILMKM